MTEIAISAARSQLGDDGYYSRVYEANPEAYAPVEGYLSDIYGSSGIERSQNDILNGSDPSLFASRAIDTITGKERSGANVELTLLPEVSRAASDYRLLIFGAMLMLVMRFSPGGLAGLVKRRAAA